ncbi:hypothetical protein Misp01_27070 [Microtetraspora sp. NBRC 13810]|nr:hypothetical protein Misp01_27070 [Microtetraspora sp. NBRC 13810]
MGQTFGQSVTQTFGQEKGRGDGMRVSPVRVGGFGPQVGVGDRERGAARPPEPARAVLPGHRPSPGFPR